jgi:uncharacterized NAD(P)/FAD-binding protein YdhS
LILKEVVIIGDGFAAVVMATHLLRSGLASTSIAMVGSGELGKGNPYGCDSRFFNSMPVKIYQLFFQIDRLRYASRFLMGRYLL